jgi:bacterioferritin (cytochrome b1)
MAFEKHQRTEKGTYRRERKDSLMENLRKEYPVLNNLHGNIKTLGGAENALDVDSLSQVLKKAKNLK